MSPTPPLLRGPCCSTSTGGLVGAGLRCVRPGCRLPADVVGCAEPIGETDAFGSTMVVSGLSSISRPLWSASTASTSEMPSAPSAPAHSSWPMPVLTHPGHRTDWPLRSPGRSARPLRTASTARRTRPGRRWPGSGGGGSSAERRTWTQWVARFRQRRGDRGPRHVRLGAPWWRPDALATIDGIGLGPNRLMWFEPRSRDWRPKWPSLPVPQA